MAKTQEIINFIDNYLAAADIEDISQNGLQIEGKAEVNKIAFGVSASLECMKLSEKAGADMLITHHGLLWGKPMRLRGCFKKRVKFMLQADMNLAAWHLPLDIHAKCGNNAKLMEMLGAKIEKPFGYMHSRPLGFSGSFPRPILLCDIEALLSLKLSAKPLCFNFGSKYIKTIAIVSGGAAGLFEEAIEKGIDLYITGEAAEQTQELARESGSNFIAAGHYNTEKCGVLALSQIIKQQFKLKVCFIDVPNIA